MSQIVEALAMYRQAHEGVARYTIGLSEFAPVKRWTPVREGLEWSEARLLCDQLNAARPEKYFGSPIYALQLENPNEAFASVRVASAAYWGSTGAGAQ